MKKALWPILFLVFIVVGIGIFIIQKKSPTSSLNDLKQVFQEKGDTDWQYQKNILTPLTAVSGSGADVSLGDLTTDKTVIKVPKGSFDTDTNIIFSNPSSVPKYIGKQIDVLGAPIEISANNQPVRLNEPATISFSFDKTLLTANESTSTIRVAYFSGENWDYIRPTAVDSDAGLITFETYHFSLFGATKIKDETVLTESWLHSKTLDKQMKTGINKVSDHVAGQIIDLTLEKMGISDKTLKGKVLADVLKDDGYKEIYDAYNKGNVADLNQKIALLAGKKIAQIADKSVVQEGLKNLVKGAKDVVAVSKAAGYIAGGQYKDAAKVIGEQIADKFVITAAGKIAVEVVGVQIESWKNSEVEAAYTAFRDGSNAKFYGYSNEKNDFDAVWTQMRGVSRQLSIEAIKKENAVRSESGMPPLTEQQMDAVRENVKESYRSQFVTRSSKEEELKKEEEKLRTLVEAFKKNNLFDTTTGPVGLAKGFDYEMKLDILYHFAEKMMQDTGRFDLSDKNGLIMDDKISVDDLAQGARLWFSGKDGQKLYAKFLKDRFNIDSYPALKDLGGAWSKGLMKIVDVIVPEALKNKPKTKTGDPLKDGCDFSMDLSLLKGKEVPIQITLNPSGESGGTLIFGANGDNNKSMSFTYTDGNIGASFSDKGAVAVISLAITANEINFLANGSMSITYTTAEGSAKIITTITMQKPIKPVPPAKQGTKTPTSKKVGK